LGFEYQNKLGKSEMQGVSIGIPVNKTGEFDLLRQQKVAEKYDKIYEFKENMIQHIRDLSDIVIVVSD